MQLFDPSGRSATVKELSREPTEYVLKVVTESDGYIMSTRSYYPGWKAEIDGEKKDVVRANYAFSAIPVSKGEHVVRFYYDPISYKIGLIASGLGVVVLMILVVKRRRISKNKK